MKGFATILICLVFFGNSFAQKRSDRLRAQYKSQITSANLLPESDEFVITDAYQSKVSGVHHIYFKQKHNGLGIIGTESSVHFKASGALLSADVDFIPRELLQTQLAKSSLSVASGLQQILTAFGYSEDEVFKFIQKKNKTETYSFVSRRDSNFEGEVVLSYMKGAKNELYLVWHYLIQDAENGQGWTVLMDANTAEIYKVYDWEAECLLHEGYVIFGPKPEPLDLCTTSEEAAMPLDCSYCYEVIPQPFESPYESAREIVESPEIVTASPYGWHSGQTTKGNNVNAYYEENQNVFQPYGGNDLNFTGYAWSENYSVQNRYIKASITNLFYLVNRIHDILYIYGFDERAGNFQEVNAGGQGDDEDSVRAWAQHANETCNAGFGFGPDGFRPLMKMNVCDTKDGSFDATVVFHEFSHGVYGRLTGGPNSSLCSVNRERPTEGVADWLAIMLTMQPGDTEARSRQIAKYFFNQGIDGDGIRNYPYSTDMAINPLTYDSIKTASAPHGVGAVWGTILWEITWDLINEHGYNPDLSQFSGNYDQDEGNIMALAIVIEALKAQPCNPGFIDARTAVIYADLAIYQGRNSCLLWNVFARRGLGEGAEQGDVTDLGDGIESFIVPSAEAYFFDGDEIFCFQDITFVLGGGLPVGGVYSGTGVTDNGDGESYTFNVADAGPGNHEIIYSIEEAPCQLASSDEAMIEVFIDVDPPLLSCIDDVEALSASESKYSLIDYSHLTTYSDNCDDNLSVIQIPEAGTLLDFGDYPIQLEVEDYAGNKSVCKFTLRVIEATQEEAFNALNLFPNPTTGDLILDNSVGLKVREISFYDINGRRLKNEALDFEEPLTELSIEAFAAGTYFAIIEIGSDIVARQVIKL